MKHNPKYYKTIVELTKIQIIFIAITVFISIADFDIITQHFFTSILSHEIEYFKTIKDIIIHLLLYYLLMTIFANIYFQNLITNNNIEEGYIVNKGFLNLFFALTSIALTYLFGIKDITLQSMFPNELSTQWSYTVVFYWYTGIISLFYIYFKQLSQIFKSKYSKK